jgi:hypothetical protein
MAGNQIPTGLNNPTNTVTNPMNQGQPITNQNIQTPNNSFVTPQPESTVMTPNVPQNTNPLMNQQNQIPLTNGNINSQPQQNNSLSPNGTNVSGFNPSPQARFSNQTQAGVNYPQVDQFGNNQNAAPNITKT